MAGGRGLGGWVGFIPQVTLLLTPVVPTVPTGTNVVHALLQH